MLATFFVMFMIFQCIESVTKISNLSTAHFVSNIECDGPANGWGCGDVGEMYVGEFTNMQFHTY